jgi:hypothetical protein
MVWDMGTRDTGGMADIPDTDTIWDIRVIGVIIIIIL